MVVFYDFFCEGPYALRKYALTAVRGLSAVSVLVQIGYLLGKDYFVYYWDVTTFLREQCCILRYA